MVFLCHDITDIFMETAKMFGYVEAKRTSIALFVWFIAIWFAARLYYFPVYVIRSVWSEPIDVRPSWATIQDKKSHLPSQPGRALLLLCTALFLAMYTDSKAALVPACMHAAAE